MFTTVVTMLDLLAPFVGALVLFTLAAIGKGGDDALHLQIPVPFIGHFDRRVSSLALRRVLLILGGVVCLIIPAVRNYDDFFPKKLQVEAFFDDDGVEKSLGEFSPDERASFRIAPDWRQRKQRYFDSINAALAANGAGGFQFQTASSAVHSNGDTEIEVHRIHGWRQRYQFTRIHGTLSHSMDRPGAEPARIKSEFDLITDGDSIVELPFLSAYFGRPIVIRPEFKQLMWVTASKEIYHHNLVAATRIDLFPLIDIGNSVYLWTDADGLRVPIGYAVYVDE